MNIFNHCSSLRETWVPHAKWQLFLPEAMWFPVLSQLSAWDGCLKPDGRVRGIVVSDVLRRLGARTMAAATALFHYTLKTRAGCECVSHVVQTLSDLDPNSAILSVDGVAHSLWYPGTPSWQVCCRWQAGTGCFFSSGFSTAIHQCSCGRTIWEEFTTSHRARVGNKGTYSCLSCSVFDNTRHWLLWRKGSKLENDFRRPVCTKGTRAFGT